MNKKRMDGDVLRRLLKPFDGVIQDLKIHLWLRNPKIAYRLNFFAENPGKNS